MHEFLADVGNSRIKVAEGGAGGLVRTGILPLEAPEQWPAFLKVMHFDAPAVWTLAGTNPERLEQFANLLHKRDCRVARLDDFRRVPVTLRVDEPQKVGIDRLLNAVAALDRLKRGVPAVVVGAGSAITVDLIDAEGVFRGGAILPGYRLMAKSLNDYTARLPLVDMTKFNSPLPGVNTAAAIAAGIGRAVCGGVQMIVEEYARQFGPPTVFLAGGDASRLTDLCCEPQFVGEFFTLEGLNLTVRAQA